jgi:hypothetical protein
MRLSTFCGLHRDTEQNQLIVKNNTKWIFLLIISLKRLLWKALSIKNFESVNDEKF